MLAEFVPWQWLLDGLGSILAWLFSIVGNYGIAIILLTILLKVVLLPLAWKQTKSMQHMQAVQPDVKKIREKYKNNKQKQQEETMKLYRETGVNPLGGCLPMLLLYPFLIAMYQIIAPVTLIAAPEQPGQPQAFQLAENKTHVPQDSALLQDMLEHEGLQFLGMNLQCTPLNAGKQVEQKYQDSEGNLQPLPPGAQILDEDGNPLPYEATTKSFLDCGTSRFPDVIPYALMLVLMAGAGFIAQRQMMAATPPGGQASQQQAIMKYLPIMFGVIGINFPAGLIVYWSSQSVFQIGQQVLMLRLGHIGPEAMAKRKAEIATRAAEGKTKQSIMGRLSARAEDAQKTRDQKAGSPPSRAKSGGKAAAGTPKGTSKDGAGKRQPSQPAKKAAYRGESNGGKKPRKGAPPGNQLKKKR